MTQYQLYCLSDWGTFTKSHEIVVDRDPPALSKARDMTC
jgi:hypothetical protein